MDQIGDRLVWYYIPFTDVEIPMNGVNIITLFNALLVMIVLFALCKHAVSNIAAVPGRGQFIVEQFVGMFDNLVESSLELETRAKNRKFLPLILFLFMYLILANVMSFLPTGLFEEPTADINTTLGLGLLGMTVAVYSGMRAKGAFTYIAEMMGPLFTQEDATGFAWVLGKLSALYFFPLNVVGEMAKVVSISFRIFGNIIGSGIIIIVISTLIYSFSPLLVGMNLFFIFFIGIVHAFVFAMLTLTYIAVAIK